MATKMQEKDSCIINNSGLDTLKITTQQPISMERIAAASIAKNYINGGAYRNAFNYRIPESPLHTSTTFAVRWEPTEGLRVSGYAAITFQPSDYVSMAAALITLRKYFPGLDFKEPKITELHAFVDLPLPLDFFEDTLNVRHKRVNELLGSDGKSIVIGKPPVRISIYNKAIKSKKSGTVSRVEVQYRSQQCPIKRLSDLHLLRGINPFVNFQFIKVGTGSDRIQVRGLEDAVKNHGMFRAIRKEIMTHRVPALIKSGYLVVLDEPDLPELFKRNITAFLSGVEDVLASENDEVAIECVPIASESDGAPAIDCVGPVPGDAADNATTNDEDAV